MSTEQKDLEQNALASRITSTWDRFKQGKLISYRMMALLIIAVTAIGLTWYILRERAKTSSRVWVELESATTVTLLEEYEKGHADNKAGKIARLHIARTLLGPEGIGSLGSRDPKAQQTAVENIEKAREMFEGLAKDFKDDPIVKAECYLGCAKAEEALIGIPKKDKPQDAAGGPVKPEDSRGDPKKVVEWLDKLAEAAPDTPWGNDAKKLAAALRETPSKVGGEILNVQSALAKSQTPSLPPLPPIGPGATPPSGTPPGVPGVPGFTPEKPGTTAPSAGTPPGPTPPMPPEKKDGTPPTPPTGTPPDPKAPTGPPPMSTPPGPKPPEKKDAGPTGTPPAPKPPEPMPTPPKK